MASYSYVAIDKKGREIKGAVEAEKQELAVEKLKKDGLVIASLNETGALGRDVKLSFMDKKPSARDMAVFCRQFVSIVNAGVSVISALEMLADQTENKKLRAAISDCKLGIEKGEALASSMRRHDDIFPSLFITMVEAGEASGSLDKSFLRMAEQFEKEAKLKATIKKASIYPIIVCLVAVGVIIGMLLFVIPKFQSMFDQMGATLPAITLGVINASKFMQHYWFVAIGAVVALVLAIKAFARSRPGQYFFGKISMKLGALGKLTVKTACARMARTLSTLLGSGIPLIDAIEITSNTMTNVYFRDALVSAKDEVAVGSPLSEPLKRSGIFPPMVYHMLGIGEETGGIDDMLGKLADYYEEEVEEATARLMAALEPLIIILLAGIVFYLVLSIILPMTSMYAALDSM